MPVLDRLVAKRPADLHRQRVVQPVDQVADVIGHVAQVQAVAAAVARVEHFLEVLGRRHDRFVVRQGTMAQVADLARFGVGIHQPLGQQRQALFEFDVGCHGKIASWSMNSQIVGFAAPMVKPGQYVRACARTAAGKTGRRPEKSASSLPRRQPPEAERPCRTAPGRTRV